MRLNTVFSDVNITTMSSPFGFGGGFGYQEEVTGLKLLGHRIYDSSTGRFITRDPIKDGRNWYVYCDSDPIVSLDPTGLAFTIGVKFSFALVVGAEFHFALNINEDGSKSWSKGAKLTVGPEVSAGLSPYVEFRPDPDEGDQFDSGAGGNIGILDLGWDSRHRPEFGITPIQAGLGVLADFGFEHTSGRVPPYDGGYWSPDPMDMFPRGPEDVLFPR